MICKYFLLFCELSFQFLEGASEARKVLTLTRSSLSTFSFVARAFGAVFRASLSNPWAGRCTSVFSPKNFSSFGQVYDCSELFHVQYEM